MAKPIVSILIPVYNVENYLEKCLDSVISQTMNNIEIICVNDGSTDHSGEILEKYQKKDKRIIVVNKENGGLPSARNAGLEIARGKYIGFVDSDDYINSDMYEKMYRAAKKHDSDVVICGANIYPEEPHADQWLYNCLSPKSRYYDKFEPDILFQEQDMSPFLWRTMVSRRLIEKKNFRLDEEVQIGEDKAFQNKIYPYANSITVISDKLYNYCWYRPGSLMERNVYTDPTLKVEKHIKLIETMSEDINKLPLSTDLRQMKESFLKWAISFIYNDFVYCTQKQKKNCANRLIQVLKNNNVNAFLYYWDDNLKSQYVYIKGEQEIDTSTEVKLSLIIPCEYESTYFGTVETTWVNGKKYQIITIESAPIIISTSVYSKIYGKMPMDDFLLYVDCSDTDLNYMLDEFYLALGQENRYSKFFHLFSIIEFIEKRYEDNNGASKLFDSEEIDVIVKAALDSPVLVDKEKEIAFAEH